MIAHMNYLIDCGFSTGCFSAWRLRALARAGQSLSQWAVYGFEPDRRWESDPRRALIHEITGPALTIYQKAAWIENGEMTFYPCKSRSSSYLAGAVHRRLESGRNASYKVETVDLNQFILGLPDKEQIILKMDIEGGEFYVLPHIQAGGAADLLTEAHVEYHARMNMRAWMPILQEVRQWWASRPWIVQRRRR